MLILDWRTYLDRRVCSITRNRQLRMCCLKYRNIESTVSDELDILARHLSFFCRAVSDSSKCRAYERSAKKVLEKTLKIIKSLTVNSDVCSITWWTLLCLDSAQNIYMLSHHHNLCSTGSFLWMHPMLLGRRMQLRRYKDSLILNGKKRIHCSILHQCSTATRW